MNNQEIIAITASELLDTIQDMKSDGYRLGQVCATKVADGIDILYSLDKNHVLKNLRMHIKDEEPIQSITHIYWAAFVYENELQDLFGIKFKNMELNFGGNFFKTSKPTPWNPDSEFGKEKSEAKEAGVEEVAAEEAVEQEVAAEEAVEQEAAAEEAVAEEVTDNE